MLVKQVEGQVDKSVPNADMESEVY